MSSSSYAIAIRIISLPSIVTPGPSSSLLAVGQSKLASDSVPLAQNSGFLSAEGSSSLDMEAVLEKSGSSEDGIGNSGIAPFEEDVLMDDYLDYINDLLMEEGMEYRTCMRRDCITYQAIMKGFYEIIGEHSSVDSSEDPSQECLIEVEVHDENSCINQVLKSNPSTPVSDSSSLQRSFREEKSEADRVEPWLNESSAELPENFDQINYGGHAHGRSTDGYLSFVKNEDLKVEADYASLYAGEGSPRRLAREQGYSGASANRKKSSAVGNSKEKGRDREALGFLDLLMSCAQAVAGGDVRRANEVLQEVRQHGASPTGSGLHRMAHYFSEALVARMSGAGGHLYTATSDNAPSAAKMLKAVMSLCRLCPYFKLLDYFANQSILKAAEGASRLHVVDYGILYGTQWPCLINALAERKGGPPMLVITGIEMPYLGPNPAERIEETGRRLAEYARTYNVPFEYHAIAASKWEDVEPASLHLQQGEVLVVNCKKRFRHLFDESVVASNPRQKVLSRMRSLNPDLLVTAMMNATHNTPLFFFRFREALNYYSNEFDMLDTTWDDSPERMTVERDLLGREILNIVACEGVERVERPETYKQWQARIQRAGFRQLPIIPTVLSRARSHVENHCHKDFNVHEDSNRWMLMGWKGRTSVAISAWKPVPT